MLNKKLLAVAIVGTLVAGNAAAANLSASGGAIPAIFAKEIVVPSAGIVLNSSGNPAADLTWNVGYNFSAGEVRYARLECSNTIKFAAGTAVTLSDPAAGNVGSPVMGHTYAGPGATIGPAMTFAYLAVLDILGEAGDRSSGEGVAETADRH